MLNPPLPTDIIELRKTHKISRKDVAEMLYVDRRTVGFWESGERTIPLGLWELLNLKLGEISLSPQKTLSAKVSS